MKKLFLTFIFLIGLSSFSQSTPIKWEPANSPDESVQDSITENSTTTKEYLYLTKGYKEDLATGKDIISGYKLLPGYSRQVGNYKFSIQYLYQNDDKLKAISVVVHSFVSGKDHFLCIPVKSQYLLGYHYEQIKTFTPELAQAYSLFMAENYSNTLFNYDLEIKNKK